jgi:hypothetical protein
MTLTDWPILQAFLDRSADALAARRSRAAPKHPANPLPSELVALAGQFAPGRPDGKTPGPKLRAKRERKRHKVCRETLRRVALACGPPYIRAEIHRAYAAETGWTVSLSTIADFLVGEMGLPKVKPGNHAGGRERVETKGGPSLSERPDRTRRPG